MLQDQRWRGFPTCESQDAILRHRGSIMMKIGAMTACFRKPFRESLEICSRLGVDGVQVWATDITYYDPTHPIGELDPDTLTGTGRQDLLAALDRLGLEISALCGDLGRGFV